MSGFGRRTSVSNDRYSDREPPSANLLDDPRHGFHRRIRAGDGPSDDEDVGAGREGAALAREATADMLMLELEREPSEEDLAMLESVMRAIPKSVIFMLSVSGSHMIFAGLISR